MLEILKKATEKSELRDIFLNAGLVDADVTDPFSEGVCRIPYRFL